MDTKRYTTQDVEDMLRAGRFRPRADLAPAVQQERQANRPPLRRLAAVAGIGLVIVALIAGGTAIALSTQEKAATGVDYGVKAVYEAGLIHPTEDKAQSVGGILIAVDWVYADWNQVLIAYTAQGQIEGDWRVEGEVVSAAIDGRTVEPPVRSMGYIETGTESNIATFDLPADLRSADSIDVEVVLGTTFTSYSTPRDQLPEEISTLDILRSGGGETAFTLNIPVMPGRILEAGESVEVKGYTITLDNVVLAPSMTTADICFDVPDPVNYLDWQAFTTLTANGEHYDGGTSGDYEIGATRSCQPVQFRYGIPLDRDRYVLTVDELYGSEYPPGATITTDDLPIDTIRVRGPWRFVLTDRTGDDS
jgi:hypothetical protein